MPAALIVAVLATAVGGHERHDRHAPVIRAQVAGAVRGRPHPALARASPTVSWRRPPVVAQVLHNDCEAAALQSLLASTGVFVGQLTLQRQLARSGPLDPVSSARGRVWGDPSRGFVGRADGGGPAGGFGVYQQPVLRLAARHGRRLQDLSGRSFGTLVAALRARRPVVVWVALSDGPYGHWTTPRGRPITVNFGEHAVVAYARASNGGVRLMNPLSARRETWDRRLFERRWRALGRRALAA